MSLARRKFLQFGIMGSAMCLASGAGAGQAYPTRAVRFVVPSVAGGTPDILARLMAHWLSERLGQPFVVENRAGAGTNLGTEDVVRAPADGYTLLLVSPASAINATLYQKLDFNFIRDIAPVVGISRERMVLLVHPSSPVKTVAGLIARARQNPGTLNMASSGIGTAPHMAGELFRMMAGISVVHVPYRSAMPAFADLLKAQVDFMFATMPAAIGHVRAGRLRAIAVTTATRSKALPDTPALAEFLPGYEASSFFGIGAPAGTPADIIRELNSEVNAALADSKIKARFEATDSVLLGGTPRQFGDLIADETQKWGKVVKFAGLKPR